jgi:hypothetical protein
MKDRELVSGPFLRDDHIAWRRRATSPVVRTPRPNPTTTPVRSTQAGKPTSGSEIDAPMTPATLPRQPPAMSSVHLSRITFSACDVPRGAGGFRGARAAWQD